VIFTSLDALRAWIDRHREEWYEDPIAELENRDAIRDHALGAAYAAHDLDVPARYEVHLGPPKRSAASIEPLEKPSPSMLYSQQYG
jgi:hypothetical protein